MLTAGLAGVLRLSLLNFRKSQCLNLLLSIESPPERSYLLYKLIGFWENFGDLNSLQFFRQPLLQAIFDLTEFFSDTFETFSKIFLPVKIFHDTSLHQMIPIDCSYREEKNTEKLRIFTKKQEIKSEYFLASFHLISFSSVFLLLKKNRLENLGAQTCIFSLFLMLCSSFECPACQKGTRCSVLSFSCRVRKVIIQNPNVDLA